MPLDHPNIWSTLTDRFALGDWSIDGPNHWKNVEPTIGTCWDVDRMDLPRVGIQPDPQKMSTQAGHDYARLGPVALER